jgi:hypothetical protein
LEYDYCWSAAETGDLWPMSPLQWREYMLPVAERLFMEGYVRSRCSGGAVVERFDLADVLAPLCFPVRPDMNKQCEWVDNFAWCEFGYLLDSHGEVSLRCSGLDWGLGFANAALRAFDDGVVAGANAMPCFWSGDLALPVPLNDPLVSFRGFFYPYDKPLNVLLTEKWTRHPPVLMKRTALGGVVEVCDLPPGACSSPSVASDERVSGSPVVSPSPNTSDEWGFAREPYYFRTRVANFEHVDGVNQWLETVRGRSLDDFSDITVFSYLSASSVSSGLRAGGDVSTARGVFDLSDRERAISAMSASSMSLSDDELPPPPLRASLSVADTCVGVAGVDAGAADMRTGRRFSETSSDLQSSALPSSASSSLDTSAPSRAVYSSDISSSAPLHVVRLERKFPRHQNLSTAFSQLYNQLFSISKRYKVAEID